MSKRSPSISDVIRKRRRTRLTSKLDIYASHRHPLQFAARNDASAVVKLLLDEGASIDDRDAMEMTPLMHAASLGNSDMCSLLLTRGANVLATTGFGMTSLHFAVSGLNFTSSESDCKKAENTVTLLISKGASVGALDSFELSPLHYAANSRNPRLTSILLDHGAVVDARDKSGLTPFLHATTSGNMPTAKILHAHGADISVVACFGQTCLHLAVKACCDMEMAMFLITEGADLRAKTLYGG